MLCRAEGNPLIVTVLPVPAPLAIVATPLPLTTTPPASYTETTVPAPLLGSGLAVGKEVSFEIATNPPKALVTVKIRSFTALEVGNSVSLLLVRDVALVMPLTTFKFVAVEVTPSNLFSSPVDEVSPDKVFSSAVERVAPSKIATSPDVSNAMFVAAPV